MVANGVERRCQSRCVFQRARLGKESLRIGNQIRPHLQFLDLDDQIAKIQQRAGGFILSFAGRNRIGSGCLCDDTLKRLLFALTQAVGDRVHQLLACLLNQTATCQHLNLDRLNRISLQMLIKLLSVLGNIGCDSTRIVLRKGESKSSECFICSPAPG